MVTRRRSWPWISRRSGSGTTTAVPGHQISGIDPENITAGDIDKDSAEEIVADFGTVGLWLWNGGVWSQISAMNPD